MPRKYNRKPKAERLNLKLWAEGCRESVLAPHVAPFADAKARGWTAQRDYLNAVCTEYHTLISWRLQDHEEPPTPLPPYDPNAIPVEETLTPEENLQKLARIKKLNKRIRRWFEYRVAQLNKLFSSKLDPRKNPYATLLAKLSGINQPPKARQAYQQFMVEEYSTKIAPVVDERWEREVEVKGLKPGTSPLANFRAKVARDLFNRLPPEEQKRFSDNARAEAQAAKDEYEKEMNAPPKLDPESIQKCVDNIPHFLGPIIRGVQERTKYKFLVLYGGPCPRFNGQVTGAYISYGTNRAANPVTFAEWPKGHFQDGTWPRFKEWLTTCYTDTEINAASLNIGSQQPMQSVEVDSDDNHSSEEEPDTASEESESEDKEPVQRHRPKGHEPSSSKQPPKKRARLDPQAAATSSALPSTKASSSTFVSTFAFASTFPSKQLPKKRARLGHQNASSSALPSTSASGATLPSKQPPKKRARVDRQTVGSSSASPSQSQPSKRTNHSNLGQHCATTHGNPSPLAPGSAATVTIAPTPISAAPRTTTNATHIPAAVPNPSTSVSAALTTANPSPLAQAQAPAAAVTIAPTPISTSVSAAITTTNPSPLAQAPAAAGTIAPTPISASPMATVLTPSPAAVSIPTLAVPAATADPKTSAPAAVPMPEPRSPAVARNPVIPTAGVSPPLAPDPSNLSSTPTPPSTSPVAPGVATNAAGPREPMPSQPNSPSQQVIQENSTTVSMEPSDKSPPSSPSEPMPMDVNPPLQPQSLQPPPLTPHVAASTNTSTPIDSGPNPYPTCPSAADQWFQDAFNCVTAQTLGADFSDILNSFIAIESAHQYQNPLRGLPTRLRPDELKRWIAGGRWRVRSPIIRDPIRFGTQWWTWYLTLQPRWREISNGRPLAAEYGSEWESLLFPGQNGILSIIATVYWWGCAALEQRNTQPDTYSAWQEAVRDVAWVLRGLRNHLG